MPFRSNGAFPFVRISAATVYEAASQQFIHLSVEFLLIFGFGCEENLSPGR